VGGAGNPISRTSLASRNEHVFFQGVLEKRAGNFTFKSSWHERYFVLATVLLRTSPAANAETIKSTGLFYFEVEDGDPHSPSSMCSPLQGYFDLSFFCNVKTRAGKDADYRYQTVIRCPDLNNDSEVKELRVRALKSDRNGCRNLNAFRDVCIEHIRECNAASIRYQRAFDRELFFDQVLSRIPLVGAGHCSRICTLYWTAFWSLRKAPSQQFVFSLRRR